MKFPGPIYGTKYSATWSCILLSPLSFTSTPLCNLNRYVIHFRLQAVVSEFPFTLSSNSGKSPLCHIYRLYLQTALNSSTVVFFKFFLRSLSYRKKHDYRLDVCLTFEINSSLVHRYPVDVFIRKLKLYSFNNHSFYHMD